MDFSTVQLQYLPAWINSTVGAFKLRIGIQNFELCIFEGKFRTSNCCNFTVNHECLMMVDWLVICDNYERHR